MPVTVAPLVTLPDERDRPESVGGGPWLEEVLNACSSATAAVANPWTSVTSWKRTYRADRGAKESVCGLDRAFSVVGTGDAGRQFAKVVMLWPGSENVKAPFETVTAVNWARLRLADVW